MMILSLHIVDWNPPLPMIRISDIGLRSGRTNTAILISLILIWKESLAELSLNGIIQVHMDWMLCNESR